MGAIIEFRDIYKIYAMGDNEVRAIDGVSFKIEEGEFVAIVGQSGSGKSTCMNIIGALDVPTEGSCLIAGQDISDYTDDGLAELRNRTLGFVFQQYNLIPKLSVYENVELPLIYSDLAQEERDARVRESLEKVGLSDRTEHMPAQLSGGQQQRVSIARALVTHPSIILADEPTGALDSKTGREVLGYLKELSAEGKTVILVTHDLGLAREARRVLTLSDGKLISDSLQKEAGA
ncbi:MAG TPA: ABC transporter ATP-binding protein [Terriglobales bacterium]|nr:ABC transporter ATP-binding protein [Terriglobales bacterium]